MPVGLCRVVLIPGRRSASGLVDLAHELAGVEALDETGSPLTRGVRLHSPPRSTPRETPRSTRTELFAFGYGRVAASPVDDMCRSQPPETRRPCPPRALHQMKVPDVGVGRRRAHQLRARRGLRRT